MTHITDEGVFIFADGAPQQCELCGVIEETRPYGPNNEEICIECGLKDPKTTEHKIDERLAKAKDFDFGYFR